MAPSVNNSCTTHKKSGAVVLLGRWGWGSSLGLTGLTPWPNWRTLETDSQKGERHLRNNIQGCPLASTTTSSTRTYEYTHTNTHMSHKFTHLTHAHVYTRICIHTVHTHTRVYMHTHMHKHTIHSHTPYMHTHHRAQFPETRMH